MLIVVEGYRGSGKNLFLTMVAKDEYEKPCHSSFEIKLPNYVPLKLIDLLTIPNNINLIIDEAYAWIESRTSMKYINIFASHINFQLRKTNRDIYISCQDFSTIDKRFRENYDYKVMCSRIKGNSDIIEKYDFQYIIKQKRPKRKFGFILPYEKAKNYFKFFDTNEIIEIPAKSKIEFELLKTEPEQFLRKAIFIRNQIQKKYSSLNKFTSKNEIKMMLLSLNLTDSWSDIIFILNKKLNNNT